MTDTWKTRVENLLPENVAVFLEKISKLDKEEMGGSVWEILESCVIGIYKKDDSNSTSTLLEDSEMILDFSWEKLNTGYWKDVSMTWRYLYSYASICKAVGLSRQSSSTPQDVIKVCDIGLLMGAPVFDNLLSNIASSVSSVLRDDKSECLADSSAETETKTKKPKLYSSDTDKLRQLTILHCPSLEKFMQGPLGKNEPAKLTGCMEHWPAMNGERKWTTNYIKKIAGYRTVPVELGSRYTDDDWSQSLMTISEFVDQYFSANAKEVGYLAQHQLFDQIPELRNDICIPDYCCISSDECGESEDVDVDINAWFGPKGTVSPLHHDPKRNILAQVMGKKLIRLYPTSDTMYLYPHDSELLFNTSRVNVEIPEIDLYPKFVNARAWEVLLEEGDMLYIPPECWHHVRSLEASFSVSFWW